MTCSPGLVAYISCVFVTRCVRERVGAHLSMCIAFLVYSTTSRSDGRRYLKSNTCGFVVAHATSDRSVDPAPRSPAHSKLASGLCAHGPESKAEQRHRLDVSGSTLNDRGSGVIRCSNLHTDIQNRDTMYCRLAHCSTLNTADRKGSSFLPALVSFLG